MIMSKNTYHTFICNICGVTNKNVSFDLLSGRETPSCSSCGSTLRERALIVALTRAMGWGHEVLPDIELNKKIHGLGMSEDINGFTKLLFDKFTHTLTYYDREPKLDLSSNNMKTYGEIDYVMCTEVMEHVPPPIDIAFRNLRKLLGKNGVCIYSVPYSLEEETVEHFPNLFDWKFERLDGKKRLFNTTVDGEIETFDDLCFHSGPEIFDDKGIPVEGSGESLEMRVFCEKALRQHIADAGLEISDIINMDIPEFGIMHGNVNWSQVMVLRQKQT